MNPAPSEDYRLIPLTRGQFAKVDAADYEALTAHKWLAHWSPITRTFYALRSISIGGGKQRNVAMHRVILGLEHGDRRQGDHRNHDTLDNRRENLRAVTSQQNNMNRRHRITSSGPYKGIKRTNRGRPWEANIQTKEGVRLYLGRFDTPEAAHAAYCEAAKIHHGEFARFS